MPQSSHKAFVATLSSIISHAVATRLYCPANVAASIGSVGTVGRHYAFVIVVIDRLSFEDSYARIRSNLFAIHLGDLIGQCSVAAVIPDSDTSTSRLLYDLC